MELHKKIKGKISIGQRAEIKDIKDLSMLYTPGVARPSEDIKKNPELVYDLTIKRNTVAVVTDGTRVLGLGDIGPEAALPVMEGKALIMKQFADLDAFPICLKCRSAEEIVEVVKCIEPVFGAINLEDIETPKVFEIEEKLIEELNIPVFHDDQHGTAIVTLAGLINALKLVEKKKEKIKVGIVGAGSAGYAIAKLLSAYGIEHMVVFDSKGAIGKHRKDLPKYKQNIADITNKDNFTGGIKDFMEADVIIGASSPGTIPEETIRNMNMDSIVFAMANPIPEISEEQAKEWGVEIFGTGRSDWKNQINNAVCFPGFLRALLDLRIVKITDEIKIAAAEGIANTLTEKELSKDKIVPDVFDERVVGNIKKAIESAI